MSEILGGIVQTYYNAERQPQFDPKEIRLSETGDCIRKRVMKALGYEVTHPMSEDALRRMEAGKVWEGWLKERIKGSGLPFQAQVEVTTQYGAAGHIDILITESESLPIEVKAVQSYATKYLPDARHVDQLMAYLHFWGREFGITRGKLAYICYDNGAGPYEFWVDYNPIAGELIESALATLRQMVDQHHVPEIPSGMEDGKFPCSWTSKNGGGHCAYYGHCWGHGQS